MGDNERPWNERVMETLRQTGENIRSEAQKLIGELSDPANQERVKQRLAEMGDWAKRTAEDAATAVDQAAQRVEEAISAAARKARGAVKGPKRARPQGKRKKARRAKR